MGRCLHAAAGASAIVFPRLCSVLRTECYMACVSGSVRPRLLLHSALHVWCGTWVRGSERALAGLARLMTGYMQWLYGGLRLTAIAILTGHGYYVMVTARVFFWGVSLRSQPGLPALGRVRGFRRALHSCIWRVDPRAQCIYV